MSYKRFWRADRHFLPDLLTVLGQEEKPDRYPNLNFSLRAVSWLDISSHLELVLFFCFFKEKSLFGKSQREGK